MFKCPIPRLCCFRQTNSVNRLVYVLSAINSTLIDSPEGLWTTSNQIHTMHRTARNVRRCWTNLPRVRIRRRRPLRRFASISITDMPVGELQGLGTDGRSSINWPDTRAVNVPRRGFSRPLNQVRIHIGSPHCHINLPLRGSLLIRTFLIPYSPQESFPLRVALI